MTKDERFPKRKKIRFEDYDYSHPGTYFLTICTEDRKNIFWNENFDLQEFFWEPVGANCVRPRKLPLSNIGNIVLEELEIWDKTYESVFLSSYVIMPNHLHIIVVILADENGRPQVAPTLDRMVKQFKGAVTKKIGESIWQKSFIEHIVRNKQDYETRLNYIYENPTRWYYDNVMN